MIDLSGLAEGAWVTVDTAPLIYLLEDNAVFLKNTLMIYS